MKRKLYLVLLLCVGAFLISAYPSLDGRAVVADEGIFPPGLFAKTVGYLPGDSINVTNPATGENVELLVIGSLDPSKGIAILLSPEAAAVLQIKKDSNMLVKLTKRSGELDNNVVGTGLITQVNEPFVDNNDIVEESLPEETIIEENLIEPQSEIEELSKVPQEEVEENVEEEFAPESESIEEDEIPEEYFVDEEVTEDVPEEVLEEESDSEIVEEELPEVEEVLDETSTEEEFVPESESVVEDEIPEEYQEETESPEDEIVNEEIPEEIPAEDETAEEEFVPESESIEEDEIPEEFVPEEEIVEEPENEVVEEEPIEEDVAEELSNEETEDEFGAIILVPSKENPPISESTKTESTESKIIEESVTTEKISETITDSTTEITETKVENVEKSSEVKTITELEKSQYYIQIAVYKNQENVENVYKKFGSKYPIVIQEKNNKKFVLIGPLSVDEYGTVLQRFKAFGFKDAFLKKGR